MNINTNNSSSSSGYTSAAYSSKGVAGLASGIDTESVVQAMLMTEQNKIDKQTQQQQILEWKQDAYRDVITKINDFQDKYFNLTSDSCIRLASLYNTMSAESSSKAVSVTPSSSAVDGNFTIQVAQLATATTATSSRVDPASVMQTSNKDKAGSFEYSRSVKITVGDSEQTVDLKGITNIEDIKSALNNAGHGDIASVNDKVSVKDESGKALTYKLYAEGSAEPYEGNVKITTTTEYTDADGNTLTKNGDTYETTDGTAYTGTVKTNTKATFTSEDGSINLTAKYYKGDTELTEEQAAKVQISGEVTHELKVNADGKDVEISGSSAGLAILGFSGKVSTTDDNATITSKGINTTFSEKGKVNGTIDFTLDGITKTFNIGEDDDAVNSMEELKQKVTAAFGNAVSVNKDSDGNYSFNAVGKGRQLTISANADTMEAIGFKEGTKSVSSQIRRSDTLASLGIEAEADEDETKKLTINNVDIEYKSTDTVTSLMDKINKSDAGVKITFNDLSATFKLETKNTGTGFDIKIGADSENVLTTLGFTVNSDGSLANVQNGKNAVVNIDGTTVERSSNKMNYNGQLIDLNATTGSYEKDTNGTFKEDSNGNFISEAGSVEQKAEIKSSRDVDKVYDKLKAFVDDYNTLIEDLNKLTHEDANYKKYPPLTEAQKKEMSENEIKLWEEKSKQGLLRNDRDINSFLSEMRSAMYTKGDSNYIMSSIGINSSSQWSDYGKLSIDEDTLKSALKSNASEVAKFFTGTNGLATRLNDICKKTANTSSGSRGSLVIRAGVKGKATEKDNEIYDQLQTIKDKLEKLNKKYETRKERLWKQFNAMETALSKANSQSDYFANYM